MSNWDPTKHPRAPAGTSEGGQFAAGGIAMFDGTSADHKFTGFSPVRVINPHSNAALVTKTEGRRQYEGASRHIPLATVQSPRGLTFEAPIHGLKAATSEQARFFIDQEKKRRG